MVQESLGGAGDSRRVGCSTHEGGELWHSDGDVYALGAGRTGWYECDWRRVGRAVVVNSNVDKINCDCCREEGNDETWWRW